MQTTSALPMQTLGQNTGYKTSIAPAASAKAGMAPIAKWFAAPVIWTGGEDVVTVPLFLDV
jgi:hypothetical protein